MNYILSLLVIFTSNMANAHGSKVELVERATVVALEAFEDVEPKEVVDAFNAVKSWVSGNQIKVKAYYNSNSNNIVYVCQMDHSGEEEEMICEKQ